MATPQKSRKPSGVARPDRFAEAKTQFVDHKNVRILKRYINTDGRIQPRKYSGLSERSQRMMVDAIKRARMLALLPFVR